MSIKYDDLVRTGPNTPAGRYLRSYWQPIYYSKDLMAGRAVPVRIMSEDFTLYRGESGKAYSLEFRCAHRGTQLSVGSVEGECIRCFYHGWKYDGSGQCVEQPAEPESFANKIKIRNYPTQEYLGLIFVYLGDGAAPELPRYPEFETSNALLETKDDSYVRACNYFNNLENSLDTTHVGFVHRDHRGAFDGLKDSPTLSAEESDWGITFRVRRPSGATRTTQFGMPNIFHMHTSIPSDPEIGWKESLIWWVPIDDANHRQFRINLVPVSGQAAEIYLRRQQELRSKVDMAHADLAEQILAGKLHLTDVDSNRTDKVRLEDDIAQIGQGRIADRNHERLGRADVGVILIRKLWLRELLAQEEGRSSKEWRRSPELRPMNWVKRAQ